MFDVCCFTITAPFDVSLMNAVGFECFATDVVGGRAWFVHTLPVGSEGTTGSAGIVLADAESWRLRCWGVLLFDVLVEAPPFAAERF